MKRFKTALSLLVVSSLFLTIPTGFAATKSLSLDETITLAKEHSADIRAVENNEFSTQETIRTNIQNSYQLGFGLETYYDYIELYEKVVAGGRNHPWNKYIGMSSASLDDHLGRLAYKYSEALQAGQSDVADDLDDEMNFVGLYQAFGDNPGLTKESKYEQFKKNEAMLQNSVDLINTKYDQGLVAATRGTEAGAIKLYVGIQDLGQGLEVQQDLLKTYEDGLQNMEQSYNQGLVSKLDYENQIRTVEIERLKTENLQFQYDNLVYQLKKMCEIPLDTTLNLSTKFDNSDYKLNSPITYYETAYNNNMDYSNLMASLTYNEKNLELMDKYLPDYDYDHEFTQPVYRQEKVDQREDIEDLKSEITNKKLLIDANVTYAYNDLLVKKKQVEHNKVALDYAAVQVNNGIKSLQLGQITQLQLDQLKLQYASAAMTADQNVRAYNTGVEHFKLLINYGVTY